MQSAVLASALRAGIAGLVRGIAAAAILSPALAAAVSAQSYEGRVRGPDGAPVVGAMVTLRRGDPEHAITVWSGESGDFRMPPLQGPGATSLRVRRIGWKDLAQTEPPQGRPLDLVLEPESDPAEVAAQLPANRWYQLLLDRVGDPTSREELKRQCTYCHQQGSAATRRLREPDEWKKVIALMGRMGGMLSRDLRERLPSLMNEAYAPETAVAALTAGMRDPGFAPPPPAEVRAASVEEWDLGGRASMQHDLTVHPDGRIYSVDMTQDQLYRLDPAAPDGDRRAWTLPHGDLPVGGVFAGAGPPDVPTAQAHVGPHSIQVAPDGALWMTLALGNQLARFDPKTETFTTVKLEHGFYPHTLRFDARGRLWYSIAGSNHLGFYDPATGESRQIRLPSRTLGQAIVMRSMPFLIWLGNHVDLRGRAAEGDGFRAPIPYGVDVAPDGSVWFSQLNEHRIGRVDPDTFAIEMIETPFSGPRRMRFDAEGRLWIPGFSSSVIARFDPKTREFASWDLPIEPRGTETPYAVHVQRATGDVWICGTESDSLIRFQPGSERFTVYPLPTRVTYTREIDFDAQGRVWTSNSNVPAWQIEGGMPRLLRLDPHGGGVTTASAEGARSSEKRPGPPGLAQGPTGPRRFLPRRACALDGWLRIDARGRASLDAGSGERLAGRSYRLAGGPDELLVGIESDGDAPVRAVLAGDLARISFPEIVTLVAHSRASGVLRVATHSGARRVLFAEGEVRGAVSERVGERLSEILVRMGNVKRDDMESLCEEAGDPRAACRLAVARGLCSERDLWNGVQEHVTTIFQAILLESQGSFVLTEEAQSDDASVPGLSAEGLLMEGVRRLDELRAGRGRDAAPEGVLAAFNGAFRDIFATAEQAGAGEALRRAAESVFEDERAHAGMFRDLCFGPDGELAAGDVLERAARAAESEGRAAEAVIADALGTVVLFLLFVAGEHLEPRVHRALHARVKAIVSGR